MTINEELDPDLSQKRELCQAAYHEAGHAVTSRNLGVPIDHIELKIERNCAGCWVDRWDGVVRCVHGAPSDSTIRRIALAGILAEAKFIRTTQEDSGVSPETNDVADDLADKWASAIVCGVESENHLIEMLGCKYDDLEWPDEDIRIVASTLNNSGDKAIKLCAIDVDWTRIKIDCDEIWQAVKNVADELIEGTATKRTYTRRLDGVAFESIYTRHLCPSK